MGESPFINYNAENCMHLNMGNDYDPSKAKKRQGPAINVKKTTGGKGW